MGKVAEEAIATLRREREETLRTLLHIEDGDCRAPAKWAGTDRSVNFLLRMLTSHQMDHLQHLQKLLRGRKWEGLSEAQILLTKAHALQAELEVLALSLSDNEFSQSGPNDGDWSAQRLFEHVVEVERGYRTEMLSGIAKLHGAS